MNCDDCFNVRGKKKRNEEFKLHQNKHMSSLTHLHGHIGPGKCQTSKLKDNG